MSFFPYTNAHLTTSNKFRCFGLLLITVFCVSFSASAQSQKALENKRVKIQKEIEKINNLLFQSQKKEKNLLSDLFDINMRIDTRTKLIETIDEEAKLISKKIEANEDKVAALQARLDNLKKEYANMVVQSYKSKAKQSRLMFVLASDDFIQAYKRIQYIKQYADYRAQQGEKIKKETVTLQILNDDLKESKLEKDVLISIKTKEKDSITSEKLVQENLMVSVKKEKRKYTAEINAKQKEEKAIDKEIKKLIRIAIAKSNKKKNTKSKGFALTPEAKLLQDNFVSNKGKLPSPVKRGMVVRRYGKQAHPTIDGIVIESNGVYYATEKNANARAIFNGKVLSVLLLAGKRKAVMIQHGNYISVYKNLDNVTVKKGDLVKTKQNLGKIHTDKTTGKTILAFVLFNGDQRQNPELWVYKI